MIKVINSIPAESSIIMVPFGKSDVHHLFHWYCIVVPWKQAIVPVRGGCPETDRMHIYRSVCQNAGSQNLQQRWFSCEQVH